jgi:putative transposase
MAQQQKHNPIEQVLELLTEQGTDGLTEALRLLLNAAMLFERERFLQGAPYERTSERRDYANGFKPKRVRTRLGELDLRIPQVRNSDFYPSALERSTRSERALKRALAEMYVQGVSTRKVKAITQQLCGFEVSSSQVSRATAELDEHFLQWRERRLGEMPYVHVDARYEKVREGGLVIDQALLQALGIDRQGRRHVLGLSVSRSEAEVHWREFLQSLVKRGLCGVELITNAPSRVEADRLLAATVKKYAERSPRLSEWLEANVYQGLTVMSFPVEQQKRLRRTNLNERINRELKRRTGIVGAFPNAASLERLATAVLMEIDEDWQSGTRYLTFP